MFSLKDSFKALRPSHWVKSAFCTAALFFTGLAFDGGAWLAVLPLVAAFSLVASGGYIVNDLWNLAEDKQHPRKSQRPIASGRVSVKVALALGGLCYFFAGLIIAVFYGLGPVSACVGGYVLINTLYTIYLRKVPVLDIVTISFGFVLRVVSGAFAIGVAPSEWLMLLTYLLALVLGLGKRCGEVQYLGDEKIEVGRTRKALRWYSLKSITLAIRLLLAATFVVYLIYCYKVRYNTGFWLTAIPVGIALYTYAREAERSSSVEAPEILILRNSVFLATIGIWGAMVIALV